MGRAARRRGAGRGRLEHQRPVRNWYNKVMATSAVVMATTSVISVLRIRVRIFTAAAEEVGLRILISLGGGP